MIEDVILLIGGILLLIGAIFMLLATIGVLRLPDLYTRMHAASKAGAVGGGFILLAVAFISQDAAVSLRALAGVVFLILTTPVSAHLLARASYIAGYRPCEETLLDELESKSDLNPATQSSHDTNNI
ncbi:monovalent cation/H(+) antiporter subunit G [Devosia sp. PTR5]|uniref:Monovalent cation/H(+) antiporter subunit G n=1 Tax=Devosia oryzisoli TaxID=2774138 RepID=A0A927FSU4_9HYPH|nr:monovalent cation/H(+) antiporter subunit G [Devosia oryzisoli]MBD8065366.1 monovalent cation/H(+) antiporter subunit G [Devosia oryzisoli]